MSPISEPKNGLVYITKIPSKNCKSNIIYNALSPLIMKLDFHSQQKDCAVHISQIVKILICITYIYYVTLPLQLCVVSHQSCVLTIAKIKGAPFACMYFTVSKSHLTL
jgi:hypothetical protein